MRTSTLLEGAAVAALLFTGASGAMAQTVNGGGSSLAGPTYMDVFTNDVSPTVPYSYFTIGSGAAQTAFVNQTISTFMLPTGSTIHFAASDAILPANLQTTWSSTQASKAGDLIQLATIGTPITIPYHAIAAYTGSVPLPLTEVKVCGIFSGRINTVENLLTGSTTGSTTLHVVYRTDGSGTSFLLTQHLAAMCGTPTTGGITGQTEPVTFSATTNFAGLFTTLPANFIGGNTSSDTTPGSLGVWQQIMSTANPNVVGYLSPDYTQVPDIHSGDSAYPVAASVTNRHTALAIQPTWDQAQLALDTNLGGGIPTVADPITGYPIVGYTTMDVATCYSGTTIASELKALLAGFYNNNYDLTVEFHGFSPVSSAVAGTSQTAIANIADGHASGACASLAGL